MAGRPARLFVAVFLLFLSKPQREREKKKKATYFSLNNEGGNSKTMLFLGDLGRKILMLFSGEESPEEANGF